MAKYESRARQEGVGGGSKSGKSGGDPSRSLANNTHGFRNAKTADQAGYLYGCDDPPKRPASQAIRHDRGKSDYGHQIGEPIKGDAKTNSYAGKRK